MKPHPYGGSTRAVRIFVTLCFAVWAALSYMALFALATVFWVAWLEAKFRPGAFVSYAAALVAAIVSAIASLWLWKRVHDRPWLYVAAGWVFGFVIAVSVVVGTIVAVT
ncbi:MAG: hypothetical protein ACM30I_05770 [Gemmatimonas sp.]